MVVGPAKQDMPLMRLMQTEQMEVVEHMILLHQLQVQHFLQLDGLMKVGIQVAQLKRLMITLQVEVEVRLRQDKHLQTQGREVMVVLVQKLLFG